MMTQRTSWLAGVAACVGLHAGVAEAQLVINETLTGASSNYDWVALNGACLTAGNSTGTIPACSGLRYYAGKTLVGGTGGRLPDAVGSGALRLTNGDTSGGSNGDYQTGAVVSNFTFPSNQGLQVTFTTVTYGGDGLYDTGADGMSFFLMDGSKPPSVGAAGGSLGYSCANANTTAWEGVGGAYIGIGIDEFGNFSNSGDNTDSGPGFRAGRISMRGAGSTTFAALNAARPTWYPTTLNATAQRQAVWDACRTGGYWNYSGRTVVDSTGASVANNSQTRERLPYNYPMLAYSDLPSGVTLSNQQAISNPLRANATPITYALKITQDGKVDLSYSVNGGTAQKVLANSSIVASNGALPATFRFGFSAGTGGGSNVHEITCFKAAPVTETNSAVSSDGKESARVESGTQVYSAVYHQTNWWGQLTAKNLVVDPTTKVLSYATTVNWDAGCGLTGGTCTATGAAATALAPASRKLLTWSGSAGVPLQWSSLSTAQTAALSAGDATTGDVRLRYLRGDRTVEVAGGGSLRTRTSVLGDIVSSNPVRVGPPSGPYGATIADALYPRVTAPETDYAAFKASAATRLNVVYAGANDGLMHGFRAGVYDASGAFAPTTAKPNDGAEALGYMPAASLSTIHSTTAALDFSSTLYSHNFFVDATPASGDLYYGGAWHTWLVGGLGAGGQASGPVTDETGTAAGALYALDVTDPGQFDEAHAGAIVIGDWSSSTLSCSNRTNCGQDFGSITGTPAIRRLHNGKWAVLFGNGLNSATGTAGLFVMLIEPDTGAKSFRFLNTSAGPTRDAGNNITAKNGIVQVTPADLDGDHVTDYVYAGDLFGNVWRFDLTSSDPASWAASSQPLFTTPSGQPITTGVSIASVPGSGAGARPRVMVAFGTGRQKPQTQTSGVTYLSASQALYGVWDWNLGAWNAVAGSAAQYAVLATALPDGNPPQPLTAANLQAQTVTSTISGTDGLSRRTVSANRICWRGTAGCTTPMYGWKMTLPGSSEQVVYGGVINNSMYVVNTTLPSASQALTCGQPVTTGYTMAVTMAEGGAGSQSVFANGDDSFVYANGAIVSGIGLGLTGAPTFASSERYLYIIGHDHAGNEQIKKVNPAPGGVGGRINWIKLR